MKKKSLLLMGVILVSALFVGCGQKSASEMPADAEAAAVVEKIDVCGEVLFTGSSTLAPVVTQLTQEFAEKNGMWSSLDESFNEEEIQVVVNGGGSGAGVKAVIEGTTNFGMVSRTVSDEEKAKIDGYQEFKLGTDALTISVNPENKIYEKQNSLSTDELKKIFSGEYTHWDQVNAELPHDEIVLVTRDLGGGAHQVFQGKVMGDVEVSVNVIQAPSMGALVMKIIENKNAIGYASFGVVNQNEGKVVPINVDGVAPTEENIIGGDYKISRPLLVIIDKDVNPYEEKLIDILTSDRGMEVVGQLGFVPEK